MKNIKLFQLVTDILTNNNSREKEEYQMKISETQIKNVIGIYKEKKMKKNSETIRDNNYLFSNPSIFLVSADLKKYHDKYRELPNIRENLVQDLRDKIQCETYQVHGIDVVKKLIGREAADLLGDISENK